MSSTINSEKNLEEWGFEKMVDIVILQLSISGDSLDLDSLDALMTMLEKRKKMLERMKKMGPLLSTSPNLSV